MFLDGRCNKLGIDASVFFPTGERTGMAKEGRNVEEMEDDVEKTICALCPRQLECAEYAIEHRIHDGVFGYSSKKRQTIRLTKKKRIKIAV